VSICVSFRGVIFPFVMCSMLDGVVYCVLLSAFAEGNLSECSNIDIYGTYLM